MSVSNDEILRAMRWIVGLALVAPLALASTAHAAPPKRVAGVKLSWPSKTVFKPGEKVTLGVRSQGRRAQVAFLSGNKVLARKTLRNGTFRTTVPAGAGRAYKLRAIVAGDAYSRTVKTAACDSTNGALKTDGQGGQPGSPLKITITNNGPGCLMAPTSSLILAWVGPDGKAASIDADGNVRQPDDLRLYTPSANVELAAGESHTINAHVPQRLAEGTYTIRWGSLSSAFTVNQCMGPTAPTTTALQLGATSVPAGGTLTYTLINTGTGCLGTGVAYRLDQLQPDGSYTTVNANQIFVSIGLLLNPGKSYAGTATIPADATPGTYRLTHESSATFEVTSP